MQINQAYYFDKLYPLQDMVLQVINREETDFYLTGGTTLARVYLQHRFSDDLDLFVNYDNHFVQWTGFVIDALSRITDWHIQVVMRQPYFARLLLVQADVTLKIEMVNDVPSRVGEVRQHLTLGRIDSPENILANKLSALIGREEPRDVADVWGLCTKLGLSIEAAIEGAQSKATGIYPLDLARRLCTTTQEDWAQVLWIDAPDLDQYLAEVKRLGEALILV